MNKSRLENLSDGVFAIVFTILVFDIHVPAIADKFSSKLLFAEIVNLEPLFVAYVVSFIILTTFWISHHALYHLFVRVVNRQMILINLIYLMFISLIPFSAQLIGSYPSNKAAIVFYGIHIICIALVSWCAVWYAARAKEIAHPKIERRMLAQAKVRITLPIIFSLLGMAVTFISLPFDLPLAHFFFAFPIVFNAIPGSLNFVERILGFSLGKEKDDE